MSFTTSQCQASLSYNMQLAKLAKRLKKEKVTVDIVNFGEPVSHCVLSHSPSPCPSPLSSSLTLSHPYYQEENTEKLIEILNGKDRTRLLYAYYVYGIHLYPSLSVLCTCTYIHVHPLPFLPPPPASHLVTALYCYALLAITTDAGR